MTPSARVVLLAGPSGSGKSTLAARAGVPRLDDFYREGDDPLLPRDPAGQVDWDLPAAWHAADAVDAVVRLATTGKIHAPHYEPGSDRRIGGYDLALEGCSVFVAEGLFADRIVEDCRAAGVLAEAVVLAPGGGRTFARRLVRDVAESRKATHVLVRRGCGCGGSTRRWCGGVSRRGCGGGRLLRCRGCWRSRRGQSRHRGECRTH